MIEALTAYGILLAYFGGALVVAVGILWTLNVGGIREDIKENW
mgnify:CR=1 FL=1